MGGGRIDGLRRAGQCTQSAQPRAACSHAWARVQWSTGIVAFDPQLFCPNLVLLGADRALGATHQLQKVLDDSPDAPAADPETRISQKSSEVE